MLLLLAADKVSLKESALFHYSLLNPYMTDPTRQNSYNACGWIDIQNDYLFFTDEEMRDNTWDVIFSAE